MTSPAFASDGRHDSQKQRLERTITLDGHSFYKKFSAHWLATNLTQPFNIVIEEKPSALWGNLVIISSQGKLLFRSSLRPGKPVKQSMITEATSTVSQNIVNYLFAKNSSQDMATVGY